MIEESEGKNGETEEMLMGFDEKNGETEEMLTEMEEKNGEIEERFLETEEMSVSDMQVISEKFQSNRQEIISCVQEEVNIQRLGIVLVQLLPYSLLFLLTAILSIYLLGQSQDELNALQILLFS